MQPQTALITHTKSFEIITHVKSFEIIHLVKYDLVRGLGGTVVRRRAHNPRVVCSIPALATFEDSILGQGVNANCASLHPGV